MSIPERVYRFTDRPMTWTKAVLIGLGVWIFLILFIGQLPSVIIYKFDQYIGQIIEFTAKIPGVNKAGLNTKQVKMIRDIIANGVQMGILTGMFVAAYIWQERARKRRGTKGHTDPVKGYMPGK
jgi:hypothetical protein